ncbi:DUF4350 domain-containing protein [Microbacterium sp. SD291]|uniref:DUF4350 domain-containing protein n=1 Tax=Microbacterium sp. SD291 TaxID=2782007 RepID=UPI001A96E51E|nr:DUF4350 domain-containing protein [Microbacterium sp. SD291]MBO0979414.1 DUF4350 domain-containing protein [Microbacterium sp. SD291]
MTVIDDATAETPPASAAASTAVRTPRGPLLRSLAGWGFLVALVLAGVFVVIQVTARAPGAHGALDPEGTGDSGAMAMAEILRDRGVEVSVFRSRAEARAAIGDDTTLVMANPYTLTDEGLTELIEPAQRVVFLSSSTHLLNLLEIGDSAAGSSAAVDAGCEIPEFADVGTIRPDRLFTPGDGVEGCFGGDGTAAVLVDEGDGIRRSVVEGDRLFSNAYLTENGNAALGLALLGQTDEVVWYVPTYGDSDIEGEMPDTLGSLTPGWVTPAILLLMLAGAAAALWRGRRFGPLVAETLPVTVRASETMHGRARLTAKAADAAHAADALRDGSRRRLARRLGLAVHAGPEEIADAAADRLRIPRGSLQSLLGGPLPGDDQGLITLARRLSELESAIDESTRDMGRPE